VVALAVELAEEAVVPVRQRESPPPRPRRHGRE
jgi:hypothetical protein